MSDQERAPRRLSESLGPAGDCVRQALASREPLLPLPPFEGLRERRLFRVRFQRGAVLLAVAATSLLGVLAWQRQEPALGIVAELPVAASAQKRHVITTQISKPDTPREAGALVPPHLPAKAPKAATSPTQRSPEPSNSLGSVKPDADNGGLKACAALARSGAAQSALDCYATLSNGDGITAELALFEQSRLEGKVLREPARALRTLAGYQRRFPQGSLRAEAMLAQIDWLLDSGDEAGARSAVDAALQSGLVHERAAELERLRNKLAQ